MRPTPEWQSARYFALLYSSAPEHSVLDALFGIEHEVLESLRPGLDHNVAHSRLQWWREECERTAGGQPVHPLTRALVAALGQAAPARPPISLPQLANLSGLVDVAVWDLASATFETRRELAAYCERWAGAMIEPLVPRSERTASVHQPDAGALAPSSGLPRAGGQSLALTTNETKWRALGAAMREVELLMDLAGEAHHGRLRVPLDELDGANAEPSTLAKPRWPDAIAELLQARHKALRAEIGSALRVVPPDQQPALRGLLVWAALTVRLSQRAERALPNRFRPERFDAISDAWFAWRVARRATAGRFTLD
jgi:15-cis-phytoene synthase